MKRRKFLQNIGQLAATQAAFGGLSFQASASGFARQFSPLTTNNRVLVIIQLVGGNDGLNMVVPLDQMATYKRLRPTISLPEKNILALGTSGAGLNPAMTGLQGLYKDGKLLIVQGLSYPNPRSSHFSASEVWTSGTDSGIEGTGWAGRFLQDEYADLFDVKYNYPVALEVSNMPSMLFNTDRNSISSVYSAEELNAIIGAAGGRIEATYTNNLAFVSRQMKLVDTFSNSIKTAGKLGRNANANYPNTDLAQGLKVVAKLIKGGLQTKIYRLKLERFDTHVDQGGMSGTHSAKMATLSEAITAFQTDLIALGIADQVVGMTFSEFGRRVEENVSKGTDHGTSVPMLVFGTQLSPARMIGKSPSLTNLNADGNLLMQYDYRRAYAAFLQDWLGLTAVKTRSVLLGQSFSPLPIFRADLNNACYDTKPIPSTSKKM